MMMQKKHLKIKVILVNKNLVYARFFCEKVFNYDRIYLRDCFIGGSTNECIYRIFIYIR